MTSAAIIRDVQAALGITVDGKAGIETWTAVHRKVVNLPPLLAAGLDGIIRDVQVKLGVLVDGKAGPKTWAAICRAVQPSRRAAGSTKADARSEKNIATLLPHVQPLARALIRAAAAEGITIKVISGNRTFAEQDALYAIGRTKPGKIVTNAKAGQSNHNFGVAFDIGIFDGARYLAASPLYKRVGALGKKLGLKWGGDWKKFRDEPHFEAARRAA